MKGKDGKRKLREQGEVVEGERQKKEGGVKVVEAAQIIKLITRGEHWPIKGVKMVPMFCIPKWISACSWCVSERIWMDVPLHWERIIFQFARHA